jgi:hypothetical protein
VNNREGEKKEKKVVMTMRKGKNEVKKTKNHQEHKIATIRYKKIHRQRYE